MSISMMTLEHFRSELEALTDSRGAALSEIDSLALLEIVIFLEERVGQLDDTVFRQVETWDDLYRAYVARAVDEGAGS
jgi:acyl carrier protein